MNEISHRDRLLAGMADAVRENGFRGTTVADVVRRAKTSRRTFYEHFTDREECFLALFEQMTDAMQLGISGAVDPTRPWVEQVDRAIDAYLQLTASDPELVHSFMHEIAALGDRGQERQRAVTDRFAMTLVRLVEEGRQTEPSVHPLSRDLATVIVGGLRELEMRALDEDRDVMELRPVITEVITSLLRPS